MKKLPIPSKAELDRLLEYDPATGALSWKITVGTRLAGSPAGGGRRRQVTIYETVYVSARLIWRMQTGDDPGVLEVDHKDRDKSNEAWDNLRLATRSQNLFNRVIATGELPLGIHRQKSKFVARINVDGRRVRLGSFQTLADAVEARRAAEQVHYQDFVPSVRNNLNA